MKICKYKKRVKDIVTVRRHINYTYRRKNFDTYMVVYYSGKEKGGLCYFKRNRV